MKKLLAILTTLLFLVLGLTAQPANAAITAPCTLDGAGTQSDPWKIGNATDLTKIGLIGAGQCLSSYSGDRYYKLTSNISLSGNFTPVELYANDGYTASLDGNGKTISGLKVVSGITTSGGFTKGNYAGLISNSRNAQIQNLKITGTSVEGDSFVGGLVGFANTTRISNVSVTLTGNVSGDTSIDINHGQMVGGLAGQMLNSSISESSFKSTAGSVIGSAYNGGAIGSLENSTATRIAVVSNVTSGNISGGLIGTATPNSDLTLDSMFYSGNFLGDQYVGGIIGYLWSQGSYAVTITNSSVSGTIAAKTNSYIPSAFVGHVGNGITSTTVSNSYSTAIYKKNTSVSQASIVAIEGNGSKVTTDNLFESWGVGSSLSGATLVADSAIDQLTDLPVSWTAVQQDDSVEVITSASWVIDGSSSPLNSGRPMPTWAYNSGLFSNLQCAPGKYSSDGYIPCLPAQVGTYIALPGQTSAIDCPVGYYQSAIGQNTCIIAPAGTFVPNARSYQPTPCPTGYTSTPGATACTITVSSGGGSTVLVTKPVLGSPPKLLGVVEKGKSISIDAGSWTSSAPIQYSYTWYRCSHPVAAAANLAEESHCVPVDKATQTALSIEDADTKKFITALVTATNSGGSATFVASSVNSKSLKYLALAAPAKLSGAAKVGATLSVTSLKWIAAAPEKTSYQWYRCESARVSGSTVGAGCKPIVGATKSVYQQVSSDKSKYVSVKITSVLGGSKVSIVAGSAKKSS